MQSKTFPVLAALCLGAALPQAAAAHGFGAHAAGFAEGFAHPFLGLDHLLAMLGVGLWASQLGGAALWRLPLAFLAVMAGAALWASAGLDAALVDTLVAGSVLALGLVVACAARLPGFCSVLAVAGFALFHGYAHGLEMPAAASPWNYGAGFLLATASLHLAGLVLGGEARRHRAWVRLGGAALAVGGAALLWAGA